MAEAPSPTELSILAESIPPAIRFGTSSWTYPGWKGLVYQQEYPKTGAAARMLDEYVRFPLFRTVGIDSAFYAPITPRTYESYAHHLPPGFPCVSKVWDRITVHTFSKARDKLRGGQPNPDFLNPVLFTEEVLAPALEHFADHLGPFVFEFQTLGRDAGFTAQQFADRLDHFFGALPREVRYAVEIRNPEFLAPPYFAVLREHNVAHVLNSWTRMPPIGEQLALPGAIPATFTVVRALLRPGRHYEEAVDAFAPYDRIQDPNPELRADIVRLIEQALALRIPAYILLNNRAEGSAPLSIAAIARLVRQAREKGGA